MKSGAQKRLAKRRKIAEASRNSQRLSSWLNQRETSKHRDGFATAEEVTSVSCINDDNNCLRKISVIVQKPFQKAFCWYKTLK